MCRKYFITVLSRSVSTFDPQLFAPTDDAFGDIDIDYYCTKGLKEITDVLLYHVAPAVVPSTQIYKGTSYLDTLYGKPVTLFKDDKDVVHVNTATVTTADFLAYNGTTVIFSPSA